MNLDRFLGVNVNVPHEFTGQICTNGDSCKSEGSVLIADFFEGGTVSRVASEKESRVVTFYHPATPKRLKLDRATSNIDVT